MPISYDGHEFTLIDPDGHEFQARGFGNQFAAIFETLDGHTVIQDKDGYYRYAVRDRLGELKATLDRVKGGKLPPVKGIRPGPKVLRERALRALEEWREHQPRWTSRGAAALPLPGNVVGTEPMDEGVAPLDISAPMAGVVRGITILVDFPDQPSRFTRQDVDDLFNKRGYSLNGNVGSVRDYFSDASNGQVDYTTVVVGPFRAPHNKSVYDSAVRMEGAIGPSWAANAHLLVKQAMDWALSQPGAADWGLTTDSDGYVLATNIMYAGTAAAGWSNGLWPHSSSQGATKTVPWKLWDYQITDMKDTLYIGTLCHENGHMIFAWPDLYDYGYESKGCGTHCLMGTGNGLPGSPMFPSAIMRQISGWIVPATIPATGEVILAPNQAAIHRRNDQEYFLVEYRKKAGRDSWFSRSGLLIWHVDWSMSKGLTDVCVYEERTPERHFAVSVEQMDGRFDLEMNRNTHDAGDFLIPGGQFYDGSGDVNSNWWDGIPSGLNISSVSAPGDVIAVRTGGEYLTGPERSMKVWHQGQLKEPIAVHVMQDGRLVSPKKAWAYLGYTWQFALWPKITLTAETTDTVTTDPVGFTLNTVHGNLVEEWLWNYSPPGSTSWYGIAAPGEGQGFTMNMEGAWRWKVWGRLRDTDSWAVSNVVTVNITAVRNQMSIRTESAVALSTTTPQGTSLQAPFVSNNRIYVDFDRIVPKMDMYFRRPGGDWELYSTVADHGTTPWYVDRKFDTLGSWDIKVVSTHSDGKTTEAVSIGAVYVFSKTVTASPSDAAPIKGSVVSLIPKFESGTSQPWVTSRWDAYYDKSDGAGTKWYPHSSVNWGANPASTWDGAWGDVAWVYAEEFADGSVIWSNSFWIRPVDAPVGGGGGGGGEVQPPVDNRPEYHTLRRAAGVGGTAITNAMNEAMRAYRAGEIKQPKLVLLNGTDGSAFNVSATVWIPEGITVDARGASFNMTNARFRNDKKGGAGGYGAAGGWTWIGGSFDGGGNGIFTVCHAPSFTITQATFVNYCTSSEDGHAIEINSSGGNNVGYCAKTVQITDNRFNGAPNGQRTNSNDEPVHYDWAWNGSGEEVVGPSDHTMCHNVYIARNTFHRASEAWNSKQNGGFALCAIGGHDPGSSLRASERHNWFIIEGNAIHGAVGSTGTSPDKGAIHLYYLRDSVVRGNSFYGCTAGRIVTAELSNDLPTLTWDGGTPAIKG